MVSYGEGVIQGPRLLGGLLVKFALFSPAHGTLRGRSDRGAAFVGWVLS